MQSGGNVRRRRSWWRFAFVRIPELFLALLVAILVLFLTLAVVARYIFDIGIEWSDELARTLFVWVVFVGFAVAVRHRGNIGVEAVVERMPAPVQRGLLLLQDAAVFGFSIFFAWQSVVTVKFSLLQRLPVMQVTIAWLYASVVVAAVLMVGYSAANLVDTLRGRTRTAHADVAGEDALRHSE